jgi:hypothetical protein
MSDRHARRGRGRWLSLVLAALVLGSSASCSSSSLAFSRDRRIRITEPRSGQRLDVPVRISWTARGVTLIPPGSDQRGAFFGVFVDRAPLKPGQNLLALVDSVCKRTPGCANDSFFAERNVHLTDKTSVVLAGLARHELHHVAIVLMDTGGSRIGEIAATVTFRAKDAASPQGSGS